MRSMWVRGAVQCWACVWVGVCVCLLVMVEKRSIGESNHNLTCVFIMDAATPVPATTLFRSCVCVCVCVCACVCVCLLVVVQKRCIGKTKHLLTCEARMDENRLLSGFKVSTTPVPACACVRVCVCWWWCKKGVLARQTTFSHVKQEWMKIGC